MMESTQVCPECRAGKHPNCTGWAFDAADEMVRCGCGDCPPRGGDIGEPVQPVEVPEPVKEPVKEPEREPVS